MSHYDLTDFEWGVIQPLLPNKPRGVPRVDDRRVLNGIFPVLRTGAPWRALPEGYGPYTTCHNRVVRWRRSGVFDRIMSAMTEAYDADWLRRSIEEAGAVPNLPSMRHRHRKACFSKTLYQERNRIERCFNKIKHFPRIATRYEKARLKRPSHAQARRNQNPDQKL